MDRANPLIDRLHSLISSRRTRVLGQVVFVALLLFFAAKKLSDDWPEIGPVLAELEWLRLAGPFLLLVLSFLFWPTGMVVFTRGSRPRIGYLQSARAFFGSQLAKYLPGGLWVFPSRVFLLQRLGFGLSLSSAALLFEMIALALSSCVVGTFFLGVARVTSVWNSQVTLLIFVGCLIIFTLFLISPELTQRFLPSVFLKSPALVQMEKVPILTRISNFFLASALYSTMWFMAGLSFYLLLVAMNPRFGTELIVLSVGVSSFSWLVGYVSFFSPGGIGIRESAIVLILGTALSDPYPLIAALISRTFWLVTELVFIIFVWLLARAKPTAHRLDSPEQGGTA